jgi:hypothetical protein
MATKRKADDSDGDWDGDKRKRKRPITSKTKKATKRAAVTLSTPSLQSQSQRVPTPETHFPFMALPQELQDIVYDELWEEDGHMVLAPTSLKERWPDRPPGRVLLDYGQPAGYHHIGLPQWLMTNVAMFQKGLKQLLTKSTLAWNETQMRRQNKLKPSPWLDFSSCTQLHAHFQLFSLGGFGYELHDGVEKRLQQLAVILSPNLKTLNITISMSLRNSGHDLTSLPGELFLSKIAVTLSQLGEINVRVEAFDLWDGHGQLEIVSDHFHTAILAAVKAMGTSVGVKGTLTSISEPWRRTFENSAASESVTEVKLKVMRTLDQ